MSEVAKSFPHSLACDETAASASLEITPSRESHSSPLSARAPSFAKTMLRCLAVAGCAAALAPRLPHRRRAPPKTRLRMAPLEPFDPLGKLEALTQSWRDGGWQVRKRKGALFPEIVPQPGPQGWAADEAQQVEVRTEAATQEITTTAAAGRDAWLATTSNGAKALSAPDSSDGSKELAVAGDFSAFLQRPEIADRYERTAEGAIVFRDEGQLGATVAAFATELTRELGAAARALARYVDDLEAELAAADEGAVLLRSQLADAEKSVEEKVSVAEAEAAEAEEAAEAKAAALARVEGEASSNEQDVQAARAAAVELETRLVDAESRARALADEAQAVARRAAAAERQAASAAGAQEATEAVLDAMKRRAEAAEESADAAARASAEALARAEASEAQLKKQLADLADSVDDAAVAEVVADATAAVAEVAAKASASGKKPALSRMRKADLILECEARGLAFEGLKVPELRVLLRGARAKDNNAN